jgi:hypothetical protein
MSYYGIRRFVTVVTKACNWRYPAWAGSVHFILNVSSSSFSMIFLVHKHRCFVFYKFQDKMSTQSRLFRDLSQSLRAEAETVS